jgi:hypothetical protein
MDSSIFSIQGNPRLVIRLAMFGGWTSVLFHVHEANDVYEFKRLEGILYKARPSIIFMQSAQSCSSTTESIQIEFPHFPVPVCCLRKCWPTHPNQRVNIEHTTPSDAPVPISTYSYHDIMSLAIRCIVLEGIDYTIVQKGD